MRCWGDPLVLGHSPEGRGTEPPPPPAGRSGAGSCYGHSANQHLQGPGPLLTSGHRTEAPWVGPSSRGCPESLTSDEELSGYVQSLLHLGAVGEHPSPTRACFHAEAVPPALLACRDRKLSLRPCTGASFGRHREQGFGSVCGRGEEKAGQPGPVGVRQTVRGMVEGPRALPASRQGSETEHSGSPSFGLQRPKEPHALSFKGKARLQPGKESVTGGWRFRAEGQPVPGSAQAWTAVVTGRPRAWHAAGGSGQPRTKGQAGCSCDRGVTALEVWPRG